MNINYEVKTSVFGDGRIAQETYSHFDDITTRINQQILDTRETQVKEALIKLGWTPPK